ncbi:MAG: methylated-DNA--[protein]-cysteine S-methyltransferase [Vulcanimicrobiaceae bacterium]
MRIRIRTPLGGDLLVATDGTTIVASDFVARSRGNTGTGPHPLLEEARDQVDAYFARRLQRFDLPLSFEGTPMQIAIWSFVARLPFGEVVSYADVGRALGHPHAHRAVATAMGRSPFDLFVPAHRVIGADGRIKGAGPGSLRRRLLHFEGSLRAVTDDAIRSSGRSQHSGPQPRRSR